MLISSLEEDIKQVKKKLGFNTDEKYVVPQEVSSSKKSVRVVLVAYRMAL